MASDKRRVALPAAVCVLLLGLAGWRFSSCAEPNLSQPELANAIFNGVNYAALGLIGLGCLFWPGSSGGQDQRAVPVAAPQTSHVGGGGIAYLANLKTFLTVVVVAHHASNQFGGPPIAMPIGTYAYDPRSPIGAAAGTDSFGVFSSALQAVDQMYFMSLFFLVSGIFCPASLDNKGFRAFVLGKILRLGGPLAIFSIILGPATIAWTAHYGGVPVQWVYFAGPCWFILWLLNFSVAYAALATVVPKVVAPKPNPPMLLLLPPLVGLPLSLVFWGISAIPLDAAWGGPSGLGGMVFWSYGAAIYIPFFFAGILAGRSDYLSVIERMPRWAAWALRAQALGLISIIFLCVAQYTIPIPSVRDAGNLNVEFFLNFAPPMYSVVMALTLIQFFHQHVNANNALSRWASSAAYGVYVTHVPIMSALIIAFVEILNYGRDVAIFPFGWPVLAFFGVRGGQPVLLSDAILWGGFLFAFFATALICFPMCSLLRRAPVLDKML